MRRLVSTPSIVTGLVMAICLSCGSDPNALFGNSLTTTSAEPPGENCPSGGVGLDSGFDANNNGTLEEGEIASTEYACFAGGALVTTRTEPPGANCAFGGQRIDHGIDDNADGALEASEIDGTTFVCDGIDGGQVGIVETTAEAAGANCANGGTRIDHGIDDNSNGTLEAGEIDGTTFVCNGTDGLLALVRTASEAAGGNCVAGGTRIEAGIDADSDGTLDAGEVDDTSFLCDRLTSLVVNEPEGPGENCANGGVEVSMGVDLNNDAVLDTNEVTTAAFLCTGATGPNGLEALVEQASEEPGENCEFGGTRITSGLDADGDDELDLGEVASTGFSCLGADGSDGAPAANGLLSIVLASPEQAGPNCEDGGVRIDAGLDLDDDGTLDLGEITSTGFACNVLQVEPPVIICAEATEGQTASLTCPVTTIMVAIEFASYGLPNGSCGNYTIDGACHASTSQTVVEGLCLGQGSCDVGANNTNFGDPCGGQTKRLFIQAACQVP